MTLIFIFLLFLNPFSENKPTCKCMPAKADEVPRGANMVIEIHLGKVKKLKGRVMLQDDTPAEEAIVEVFDYKKSDKGDLYNIPQLRERQTACKVSKDGRFCFSNLPSGTYLLRVGTTHDGFDYTLIKVTLAPRDKKSSNKEIEIPLQLGT